MKIILLGIACILFGFTALAAVAFGLQPDGELFEILGYSFPFLGIVLAFCGTFIKDNK